MLAVSWLTCMDSLLRHLSLLGLLLISSLLAYSLLVYLNYHDVDFSSRQALCSYLFLVQTLGYELGMEFYKTDIKVLEHVQKICLSRMIHLWKETVSHYCQLQIQLLYCCVMQNLCLRTLEFTVVFAQFWESGMCKNNILGAVQETLY